jgi:hypothetical protein
MATDKMNSSAVYELFEELKQKIMELERKATLEVQADTGSHAERIETLVEELRTTFAAQRQFTPEQINELQRNMTQVAAYSLGKANNKLDQIFAGLSALIDPINKKMDLVNLPEYFVIRKEHAYSFKLDFKSSWTAITIITMGLAIFFSLAANIWQFRLNSQLRNNDLKYRYIQMKGEINHEALLKLDTMFTYKPNKDSIAVIRKQVETYERLQSYKR